MPAPTYALPVTGSAPNQVASKAEHDAAVVAALTENYNNIETHKADTDNPHGVTKAQVGLGDVDNVSAAALRARADHTGTQAISTVTGLQTALDAKAPLASPTFTGTVAGITKSMVGLGNVDNTADTAKPVSTAQQTALDLKAPIASPTFTGTVSGVSKSMVGLGNVDNTSDVNKPVSTAQQAALNLKANAANPAFTGTPTGLAKAHVGLGNVDNTADVDKPVSTAQQAALDTLTARVDHIAISDETRPGENPEQFSAALTGEPEARSPLSSAGVAIDDDMGACWVQVGAGIVAPRRAYRIEDDRIYRLRIGFKRTVDSTDPSGDAVQLKLRNLNKNKATVSTGTLATLTNPEVADGIERQTFIISKDSEVEGVNYVPPATTRYVTPYGETFGDTPSTGWAFFMWEDVTDIVLGGADVATLTANLSAHTSNTSNPHAVTKAQVGLGNADNTSDANKPISTATQTALDAKAPLASPALTGTPTAPTADPGTDTTQVSTTAFVQAALYPVANGTEFLDPDMVTARLSPDGDVIDGTTRGGDLILGPLRYSLAFEFQRRTADGALLAAVDDFGVDIAGRDLDAWVAGGQVWLYVRGAVTQITNHAGDPWAYAAIRGGQLVMAKADGTRISTPLAGDYPWQGRSRTVGSVFCYGQSNAAANASGAVINGTPFNDRFLMPSGGQRAFGNALNHSQERTNPQIPVYGAIHDFVPGYEQLVAAAGETACSGLAWGLLGDDGELGDDQTLLTACPAVGSANIPMLRKAATEYSDSPTNLNPLGTPWANLEAQFIRARLFWALQGFRFLAHGMIWNQGEGHISASEASYRALLDIIAADWQGLAAEWMATAGAADPGHEGIAPLITAQTVNGNKYGYITSEVPWAQLRICTDDPTTAICLGPLYDQVHAGDGVHLTSAGQEMQGARAAVALNAWLRGEEWMPLHVTAAVRSGTTVTLTIYNHDSLPLVFDTTTITGLGADEGFTWADDGDGNAVTVTDATIVNATTVELTLSDIPTGSNPYIHVAMNGTSGASGGPATGNRSTLRTDAASPPTTRYGTEVHHFICIDRIAVTT